MIRDRDIPRSPALAMTVIVHQGPLEETRTASKSCKWIGEAIVNGKTYTATSRMAPANDIARQLVADGVPDYAVCIYTADLKGHMIARSFYEAAKRTVRESDTKPVRGVAWADPAAMRARLSASNRPNMGVNAPADSQVSPEPFAHKPAIRAGRV